MTKATHNGTCQVCGNAQAIKDGGRLAKHGYTVTWGFFNGTCSGAGETPLEFDTTIARSTIALCEDRATKLEAKTLADVTEITYTKRVRGGDDVKHVFASQAELDTYRDEACDPNAPYNFDRARETVLFQIGREAKNYRDHAAMLVERIELRHGAEPYARETGDERVRKEGFEKYRDAVAAADELKADGFKTRVSGRSPYFVVTGLKKAAA